MNNNNNNNKWQQGTKHICTSDKGHVCVHADNVVAIKIHNANQQQQHQQQQHGCSVPQQVWHAQEHSNNITTHTQAWWSVMALCNKQCCVCCDVVHLMATMTMQAGAVVHWEHVPLHSVCATSACAINIQHTHKAHDPQHACHNNNNSTDGGCMNLGTLACHTSFNNNNNNNNLWHTNEPLSATMTSRGCAFKSHNSALVFAVCLLFAQHARWSHTIHMLCPLPLFLLLIVCTHVQH